MNILSIQSHVAYGHAGNASAVFPMQRLGVEVWPVYTVQFSNHTGYGAWKGRVFDGPAIEEIIEGIGDRGVLDTCDGVLSGYMGSADIGNAILSAVHRVREANPKAVWCCDPGIGDAGRGVFVRPGIPEFIRDIALPAADIVTPNHFELEYLSGQEAKTLPALREAIAKVRAKGPKVVLATSVILEDTPDDAVDMVGAGADGVWRVRTPRLPISPNGTGDAVAALFFVHYLRSGRVADALGKSAASVFGVLEATVKAGTREIQSIAAQEEFVNPTHNFLVEAL